MTHSARVIGVLVATAALSHRADAQDWAARFPPAAECRASTALDARLDTTAARAGLGTLVVRPVHFGSLAPATHMRVVLAPVGRPSTHPPAFAPDPDGSGVQVFPGVRAGRYVIMTRQLGYNQRVDTVEIRPGASDTVTIGVEYIHDHIRNNWNCRPRGFRRRGEQACMTDSDEASLALARARSFATPERRKNFPMIAPFAATDVALVADEAVCERAAREYGSPGDPHRRVLVVRMGDAFMVYDPFEPVRAGEFSITTIFDSSWKVLVSLAS